MSCLTHCLREGACDWTTERREGLSLPARGAGYAYLAACETSVDAPPDRAFALISDPRNLSMLHPSCRDLRFMFQHMDRDGNEAEYVFRCSGIPIYVRMKVAESESPHRYVMKQVQGPWKDYTHSFLLRPHSQGTVISQRAEFTPAPGLANRALHEWVIRQQARKEHSERIRIFARSARKPDVDDGKLPNRSKRQDSHRFAFEELYRESTARLKAYAQALEPDEAGWFSHLIGRFDRECRLWESKPFLAGYLARAERCRFRALGVIAYVYLHVGYDLPRVCSNAIREDSSLPSHRRARVFADASPHIAEAYATACGQTAIFGIFALLFRLLPGGVSMAAAVVNWILAHRCAAWAAAETLANSDERVKAEGRLWQQVDDASQRVAGSWNPLQWMRTLPLAGMVLHAVREEAQFCPRGWPSGRTTP